jgi:hypothetical protein
METKTFDIQYDKALRRSRSIEETDYGHIDKSLSKKGIHIAYHGDKKKKKVKLVISPGLVLGGDINSLWKPSADNSSALLNTLDREISAYFNRECSLNDFQLTRVVFAADVDVGTPSKASAYIRLLHSIGKVKCFSPLKRDEDGEKLDKEHCFALKGNSNGVEFWANQLKNPKGVLRFEVRLTKPDTIRAYSGDDDTVKRVKRLAKNCESVFMDTFKYIIPPGEHYKKLNAEKLVRERVSEPAMRRRMLRLLTLIPEKKSLHLALKSLNYREYRDVMLAFEEIGVSPVTISKRHDVKRLESLYNCLG